ncbi:MAG: AEC family transporter [Gammaproteobacteria bacterium]|nr:AEC family transporter [Gammaproteobacteria bacterium]
MLLRILTIVFPIFAIVALGYLYARRKPTEMAVANRINMDVFLPALIFHVLSQREFSLGEYVALAVGGIAVILGSGILAYPLARCLNYDWRTFVPPMMFSNYGNIGLPLFVFAFGEAALSAGVVLFISGNLLHFTLGRYLLDHRVKLWEVVRTPMIIATILGLTFSLQGWVLPTALAIPIEMLGQVSIPLLLFSLGVRLTDVDLGDWKIGVVGAVVCPVVGVVLALLIVPWLDLPEAQTRQLILFGVLPPAVLNFLLAEQFRQEPQRVASIVMIGNLFGFVTIPLTLVFLLV